MTIKKDKILVTGALGFIGYSLLEQLNLAGSFEDVFYPGNIDIMDSRDKLAKNLYGERKTLDKIQYNRLYFYEDGIDDLPEYDFIIHLGANSSTGLKISESDNWHKNVVFASRLFSRVKYADHFIFASSASVYGNNVLTDKDSLNKESARLNPLNDYALTKMQAERRLIGASVFRFFNVFGKNEFLKDPNSRSPIYNWIINPEPNLKQIVYYAHDELPTKRDFVSADYICEFFLDFIRQSSIYRRGNNNGLEYIYNVGSGEWIDWEPLANFAACKIEKERGYTPEIIRLNIDDAPFFDINTYQFCTRADTSNFLSLLNRQNITVRTKAGIDLGL